MKFIEVIDRLEKGIFTDGTIIESNFGESYCFSERDGHFHRCNKITKSGQACQPFMRTENINKTYEIVGITIRNQDAAISKYNYKTIERIEFSLPIKEYLLQQGLYEEFDIVAESINSLISNQRKIVKEITDIRKELLK